MIMLNRLVEQLKDQRQRLDCITEPREPFVEDDGIEECKFGLQEDNYLNESLDEEE